jgi:superfamily II DNA or RNA helicase
MSISNNHNKSHYIYIRTHEAYDIYNAVKLGITSYIAERDANYATGEIKRGKFILVICVNTMSSEIINTNKLRLLETLIHHYFQEYHILEGGGNEFFKKDIVLQILPFMDNLDIVYNILSEDEIVHLIKLYKLRQIIKAKSNKITNTLKKWLARIKQSKINNLIQQIQPYPHQQDILSRIEEFYKINDIGQLHWACGLGKALLSIFIVKKLQFQTIVFGVPSIYLQNQIIKEILKLYPDSQCILCVGGNDISSTTDIIKIKKFLENDTINYPKFVITTYDSCYILTKLGNDYYFDIKIGDECHHLVCIDNNNTTSIKSYIKFHDIHSRKTLFMTATQKNITTKKQIDCQNEQVSNEQVSNDGIKDDTIEKIIYSMDDKLVFGEIIDTKSIKWAIENNKITDYKVLVLYNTITEIDVILQKYKIKHIKHIELFVSAFMTLKSITKYSDLTHILIYTNTTENSDIVCSYIDLIISRGLITINRDDLYYRALHSNSRGDVNFEDEVKKFKKARYGIISCVYIFGEGFDLPKLNGITFAENMISPIRMTQCAMRPNRLDREYPNKISYIIIPYLDMEEHGIDNRSFKKCYNILDKLRNNDDIIEHKIKVATLNYEISNDDDDDVVLGGVDNTDIDNNNVLDGKCNVSGVSKNNLVDKKLWMLDIKDNDLELEKLKLRLKYSRALKSKQSPEKDEYDYVKLLNIELKFQCKKDYFDSRDKHKHWIDNPDIYFKQFHIWINWYDYLGIDTSEYCKTKDEWRKFCINVGICSLEDYEKKSKMYKELPENPGEFYSHFNDILNELRIFNIRR